MRVYTLSAIFSIIIKSTAMQNSEIQEILLSTFSNLKGKSIKISKLGGLTNLIYKIDVQNSPEYIFRYFCGDLDRRVENQIFMKLAEKGVGPQCYQATEKYRIQKFIKDGVCPSNQEMKEPTKIKKAIENMYKFHTIQMQEAKEIPILSESVLTEQTIATLKKYPNLKKEQKFDKLLSEIQEIFKDREEWKLKLLPKSKSTLRFCHNDLNNLNYMFVGEQVFFIDFEYASYNYIAYEIANFLNELCIDYSVVDFPKFKLIKKLTYEDVVKACQYYPDFYEELPKEVINFLSLVNLYWAGWSIKMANEPSNAQFGTIEHGFIRIELFHYYQQISHSL